MQDRPVDVLFIGNCIDQGTDLVTGRSFASLTHEAIRRRRPDVSIHFAEEPLVHVRFLSKAVDHALGRGADVVMLAIMATDVSGPLRVSRLWALDGGAAKQVIATSRRMRRALQPGAGRGGGSSSARPDRGILEDSALTDLLRVTLPPLSLEAYERELATQIERLQLARCRVILRAGTAISRLLGGVADPGIDAVVERVANRHGVRVVWPWEHLVGSVGDYIDERHAGGLNRTGQRVWRPNHRAHREIAVGVDAAIGAAVDDVLADRVEGRPGVLARPKAERKGLLRF